VLAVRDDDSGCSSSAPQVKHRVGDLSDTGLAHQVADAIVCF
jgi:hypothetical protein